MKLCKMIEIYLKYDNMHTIRTINAFICINNHVNSCLNSILSVIQNLPLPGTVRDLRSFLKHVGFYHRFIQDFVKVSKPLTTLLCKDKDFIIDEEGKRTFVMLKQALIDSPILLIRVKPQSLNARFYVSNKLILKSLNMNFKLE